MKLHYYFTLKETNAGNDRDAARAKNIKMNEN